MPKHKNTSVNNMSDGELSKKYKVLSLFSGCGGMDLGFEGGFSVLKESVNELMQPNVVREFANSKMAVLRETCFETVFANDIFSDAQKCWVNYFSKRGRNPEIFRNDSIVDLVKRHLKGESIFPKDVDVVTGGFPCQDFSLSGLRNGFNSHKDHKGKLITDDVAVPTAETRGMLYMWMKQVIEITKPKIFVAENVKGLYNLGDVKTIIQNDFAKAGGDGYIVLPPQVLHAADFGVPQSRERIIFIGINKKYLSKKMLNILTKETIPNEFNPYPTPTHSFTNKHAGLANPLMCKLGT